MTKDEIMKELEGLPDDASISDAIDHLVYLYKIGRGIKDADAGRRVSQKEAKPRMANWLP